MGTSRLKDLLKRAASLLSLRLEDLYSLYANATCSKLSLDSKPTWSHRELMNDV
jgi:hypothetical protein